MIHPVFLAEIARQLVAERMEAAERHRMARPERPDGPVVLRRSTARDKVALTRLAELEQRKPASGPHVVAELAGEVVAAVGLRDGRVIANPFRSTEDVVSLLRLRARQLWR